MNQSWPLPSADHRYPIPNYCEKISETDQKLFELILQDLEQQQQSEADLAREKVEELESVLEDEKRKREACEQQIQQHLQVKTVTTVYFFVSQEIYIYSM